MVNTGENNKKNKGREEQEKALNKGNKHEKSKDKEEDWEK